MGTLLGSHDFSNMLDSVLATSASSFRAYGCMSSGPMDLCIFRVLRCSWAWSSPAVSSSSSVPAFVFWSSGGVAETLAGEDSVKKKVVISAFSISCVTSLLFWRVCTYKSFTCCSWCQSSLILWELYLSWPDPLMLGQYLCVPPRLLALASTLDTLPFCCLVCPEDHCSSLLPSWYFCLTSSLSLEY